MSLRDVMSGLQLSSWAEAALVLFVAVFVAVGLRTLGRSRAAEFERARALPLDDAPRARGGWQP